MFLNAPKLFVEITVSDGTHLQNGDGDQHCGCGKHYGAR